MAGRRERPGAVVSKAAHLSGPVRTCVGCRTREDKPALVRVVMVDAELAVDRAGRLPGRGAYVHPDLACVDLAFPAVRVGIEMHSRSVLEPDDETTDLLVQLGSTLGERSSELERVLAGG